VYFFYYVPVGLDVLLKRRPVITYFTCILCITLFFIYRYKPIGPWWDLTFLTFQPLSPSPATAVTHAFLHGGYLHLIGNIVYLFIFGRAVEDRFGPFRFFAVFAVSAMAGAYAHLVMTSIFTPQYLPYGVIGASGATSGILGAYMIRLYYSRVAVAYWVFMPFQGVNRAGRTYVPVIFAILFWFLLQGARAVVQYGMGGMHIAYGVHVGGFAAGIVLAAIFGGLSAARAEKHLVKARRHFAAADWFAAEAEYIDYLALDEENAVVRAELARAFLCSGDKVRARGLYADAIELHMERGERDLAEGTFDEASRQLPNFVVAETLQLNLACGFERTLKFRSAMKAYEMFVWKYPDSRDAPFVLLRMAALLERRFEKPSDALSCYRRLVDGYAGDRWADFARAEMERLRMHPLCLSAPGE
jgi:membrane associated rhomboid family serine protease